MQKSDEAIGEEYTLQIYATYTPRTDFEIKITKSSDSTKGAITKDGYFIWWNPKATEVSGTSASLTIAPGQLPGFDIWEEGGGGGGSGSGSDSGTTQYAGAWQIASSMITLEELTYTQEFTLPTMYFVNDGVVYVGIFSLISVIQRPPYY